MSNKITEDELDGLSDDEREALEADDEELDSGSAGDDESESGDSGDDEGDDEDEGEGEDGEGEEPEAESGAGPDDEGEGEAEAPVAETQSLQPPSLPAFHFSLPDDFGQQMQQVKLAIEEINAKEREGELDPLEATEAREALRDQRMELERLKIKAELSEEFERQRAAEMERYTSQLMNQWEQSKKTFFSMAENKDLYASELAQEAFQRAAVRVAQTPGNAEKNDPVFFLNEADKMVREAFKAPKVSAPRAKPQSARERVAGRLPPDIGGAPSAEIEEATDGGEFAYLDRLANDATRGMEFENALAKLTPEQAERYRLM